MLYLKRLKQSRGQSLVEASLIAPLIVFFLFTIIWFACVMLTWQQISTAARYGTDLIAYTSFNVAYIKNDIKDYLCNTKTVGRTLDPEKLDIKIEINDYESVKYDFDIKDISSITTLNPVNVLNTFKGLIPSLNQKSFVEITYSYKIPIILKIIGEKNIKIKARSEVLSGSGSPKAAKRQQ
jgi:Flp pilus assembly protein TadG